MPDGSLSLSQAAHSTSSPFADLAGYVTIPRLSGLKLSPDGTHLVTTVATLSPDRKCYVTALWQVDPTGSSPARRLTRSAPGESAPAYLPDGGLLFTSCRPDPQAEKPTDGDKGDPQVAALWLLPAGGGEARQVAARPGGVDAVRTAREAATVVVHSPTMPGTTTAEEDERRRTDRAELGVTGLLHESGPVRHWDHDIGPTRVRLLVAQATPDGAGDADEPGLGGWRDLTPDPGLALHEEGYDVTPDGRTVVTGWNVEDRPGYLRAELVAIDAATGERRVLASDPDCFFSAPAVSPDGRYVVCERTRDSDYDNAPDTTLWLTDLSTGEGRDLTAALDLWPHGAAWAPDGSGVYFLADEQGRAPVFHVDIDSGRVRRLVADRAYTDLCPSPDGRHVYTLRSGWDCPPTPVRLDASAVDQEPVMLPSPGRLSDLPGTLTEVSATAEDGTPLRAWLVLPDGASAQVPAPFLLWVHGGPLSSWNAWTWRWNPWLMAARGYAVLLPDPAFSTGYGQKMVQRAWGQWGGTPYTDLMSLTDAALERADLDATRTAAMGGSYGGYMANWIAGHTDRFRAIVTHASLWALDQFNTTTDYPAYWAKEWGYADQRPERYAAYSPNRFADAIRTPMLVVHGDKDYRVPIGEGLRLWAELVRRGADAGLDHKFLYFPDENHWVLKPGNAQAWYQTVLAFLDHHVLGEDWARPALL
jgi:dipeptidyl aminopeptidase/acylaminoacyl peptidase